jgi:hypothetical protein
VPPTAEEAQGGSGRSGRQRRHRKRAPYQDFPTKGGSSNEGQGSIGPGVGEVGKRLPRNRRNRPAGPAPLSDSELLESDSSGPEMNITTDSTKLAQDMINVASASKNSKQSSKHRIPFFMHLHKAAGTTICELAERNKKRAAGMGDDAAEHLGFNCNLRGDDPGHLGLGVKGQESTYGQAEGKFSCEARANILQKNSLQFTAIERWIFPAEICPSKFIYMTCFRDPISRIKSAVKFHKRQTEKVIMKWATENAFNRLAPISTGSPSVDNYYVRSFGGPKVFRKKLGTITRDDLLVATNVFSKFEIVLILEHFDRDLLQLKTKLGWKINNLGRAKSTPGKHCDFTPDQTAQLKSLNVFDYELYNFANSVAEELSKKAMFLVKMRLSA